ncbi:MAG: hypothetical protein QXI58_06515 [Candidatus Micrarchaeia archaeon]
MSKKSTDITNVQEPTGPECPFTRIVSCLKQTKKAKLDMGICTNCLLGRIETHLYAIVRKMYTLRKDETRRY